MPLTLLDYGRPNPFGETIGKSRHLAWPVNVYRVTLPKVQDDGDKLNPFESVILKLIDAGRARDAEALALETCLPKDLVQCVLLRLRDKAYLDDYNQIVQKRRDVWAAEDHELKEFVTACVFRELATGKVLPCVHFMNEKPLKKKEVDERHYLRIRQTAHFNSPPTPRDVIAALRGMQKRSLVFGNEISLPSVQLINIVGDGELYHLDCPIAIQKSDGEFRIANPFGNGFSLVLESAFGLLLEKESRLYDWFINWKNNLSNPSSNKLTEAHKEPYDNAANRARYPNLLYRLRLNPHKQYRTIGQIHAAMEWALFYSCAQRPYASAVQRLKLTNQSEHSALLQRAAEVLSLTLPPGGLFPVREGKLNDFLDGKSELGTVLSLSLLMAADDASDPLRRIAAVHQDFIVRVLKVKKDRDESEHGTDKTRSKDFELPDDAFMRDVVNTLLPSVRFSDTPVPEVDQDAVSDSLLDARTSIQSNFGFSLFNRLGTNLQNRLIAAEQFWLSCKEGDDSLAFACDLYAALQSVFRSLLSGALTPDVRDSEYAATAQKNAKTFGLGELPRCLLTAKQSAIRQTLQGNDQSLQSCVIAFLLVSDTDTMRAIAQSQPSLIADVVLVIDRRKHGNEPLHLAKDDTRTLRKAAYTTIKTLLEA